MRKVNVLLLSAGGLTGTYLIKNFRKSLSYDYRIVAADCNAAVPASVLADAFYVVPKLSEANYLETVASIVDSEQIEFIVPITSRDVKFFSHKTLWRDKMLLVDGASDDILSNKPACCEALRKVGLDVPETIIGDPTAYPLFFKPQTGSGSKGAMAVLNRLDYDYCKSKSPDGFFTKYIDGKEFTVDCLFDSKGLLVGYHNRERLKTVSGGAVVTVSKQDPRVGDIVETVSRSFTLKGPLNFQYIVQDGKYYLIDFNTRFASGGLALSVECGFDIPQKLTDLIICGQTERYEQSEDSDGKTMIRYYEELFIKNENHL